ncbi:hypothetical protein QMG61_08380 [Cryobacterium sp. PH31-AA6]|uniref:hypothetical protein n=1 Tax=Cryobacterium sp. PH31-AA6 TaxID=3046205 RepID=UPI0024BB6B6D|nr:hypothetical protein [Cryobacterium sp. PH31-AA6]MDJ0323776.1 hypothetical protein [Cryobacterium sp. PH31-AA6]
MPRNNTRKKWAVGAGGAAIALTFSLVSLGTTGAYFSDTHQGDITGTIGSIKVVGSAGTGTESLDLNFTGLLPGTPQTVTAGYQNTGASPQDVWVVFNNVDALHALNDLGTYGEFHVKANGTALFDSANLSDDMDDPANLSCGPIAPTGCWPVPKMIKIASNVGPSASGTVDFTFGYASKLKGQTAAGGGVWNSYPVSTVPKPNPVVVGSGLPYQLVATQVGQTP